MAEKRVCNICGKELNLFDEQENFSHEGVVKYGSVFDGDEISLNICCSCMDKIIMSCKVTPLKTQDMN